MGRELKSLREKRALLFASGNVVHNLRLVDWHAGTKGFDWAYEFDDYIYENIVNKNHDNILKFEEMCDAAKYAVPTPDHFYPLLYALGASDEKDEVSAFNKSCELGSLTMTGYLWE
jgi:4,5-DOPA dioxygenase extradiol